MYILILDDSELNNVLMSEALRDIPGCEIVCFTEPLKALDFASKRHAELGTAVIDYEMPEMNGIAFIRAARVLPGLAHLPIVMVTSLDQRRVRREALAAGATDFMAKPVDPIEVRARISNLLALSRARRREEERAGWLAEEIAAATSLIAAREREIVVRLVRAAESRDSDTGDHVARVARYAGLIARNLGHDPAWCEQLAFASTMHDVGKIGIRDAVLLKPGRLTPEERVEMERHAEDGFRILEGSSSDVIRLAAEIALNHHERWDGKGYPQGLAGEAIPLSGRIVAVADVFDALISDRPYKKGWPRDEARAYLIEQAGQQFDPACVKAFVASWSTVEQAIAGDEAA